MRLRRFRTGINSLVALLLAVSASVVLAAGTTPRELVFLNWADYLEPELIETFQAQCDCKLRQVYFETDDHRDELMLANEGSGYNLAIVNGYMLGTYRKRGWLAPIPAGGLENLSHLAPRWSAGFAAAPGYAMPYFWGTLGIAYRKDLVAEPITSWRQLVQPDETLRGKIRLINSARDLLTVGLKAQGASINATDKQVLKRTEQLLLA